MNLASTTVDLQGLVTLGTVDANGTVWQINLGGLTGMGQPAPNIDVKQKTRRPGGWAGDSFDGPRYPTIAGTIRANTPQLLNQAIDLLKATVMNTEFVTTFTESGRVRSLNTRRAGETITQKVTNLIATYSIMLVALDGRFFGTTYSGSTHLPATSGGLTIPFTIPFTIAATVVSGQIALFNDGTQVGKVKARVDGPCNQPSILHRGTGTQLWSSSQVLASGEWIDIDMDKHTVLAQGQAGRNGLVTSRGWSGFDVGSNVWGFSAASFDAGAQLTINATAAA